MAMSPEEWKARREKREMQRAQQKAKQKKMLIRLAIAVAVLALCVTLVVVLVSRFSGKNQEPDAAATTEPQQSEQSVDASGETEQTEESVPAETVDHSKTVVHVAAGGDVNVTDRVVAAGGLSYNYKDVFMDVAHLFGDADVAVVNLEGNLCGAPYGSATASAPQGLMDALDNAGVDLVQLANSYSINQGVSGLAETIDGVRSAGMEPLGVYENQAAYKAGKGYTICTVQGIKICFVAFTKGMDGMALPPGSENCVNLLYSDYESTYQQLNREGILDILEAAEQERPDVTIAMVHWGSEFNDTVSPSQENIVKLLQANGVDAIIGTHPHFVQQMVFDQEEGTFVAYSLGDLISDADRAGTEYSVVLDLEITRDNRTGKVKITGFSYTPIFTVAEKDKPLRVVRIAEAMVGYDLYFIGRVSKETFAAMEYALTRIEARITGQG